MNMKKQLLLLVLMLLPMMASAFVGEAEIDGINYYIVTKGQTAEVRKKSYSGDVVIPETVEYEGVTCRVTSIGSSAFSGCSRLTSVTIPNSVTSIGSQAFYNCSSLISVTIPNSVTSIGGSAFYACKGLTSFTIPNSVTNIKEGTFSNCSSLTSITIPNSVISFGDDAFRRCSSLTSITIPNSVTSIGNSAFRDCSSLTSLIIPNSVTSIGDYLFYGCSSLTSITIPNSVTSIGYEAFYGCSSLTSVHITDIAAWCKISFSDNPLSYAHHLYLNGEEVKDLVIPNSMTSIGNYTFYNCSSLISVTIPNSVTSIGWYAFSGCSSLTSITIPNSVTTIDNYAFADCAELTNYYCYAEIVPSTHYSAFDNSEIRYATLHVPDVSVEEYKKKSPWRGFGTIVGLNGETPPVPEQCAKPTIYYSQGKLSYKSETEGVIFQSTITDTDMGAYSSDEVGLTVTYHISVYATKEGYEDSDVAEATLCWIEVDPQKEGITEETPTDAKQLQALPVLIQAEEGQFSVEGAPEGTKVAVYDAGGVELGAAVSRGGKTLVPARLPQGSIAIVKIGSRSVKVAMK